MRRWWLVPVCFFIINSFKTDNEVEAGAHELVPFSSGWYGNVDKGQQIQEEPTPEAYSFAEFPHVKRRKLKAKEPQKTTTSNSENGLAVSRRKKKNKRKRKRKPAVRRFVKTTVSEADKESNMTDSMEVTKRSKPVDIIVHIKMSD